MTTIMLNDICNNACIMCTSIMPSRNKEIGDKYGKNYILSKIDEASKISSNITLSGGEPTLREDLFEILEYINQKYPLMSITLITNARILVYDSFLKSLKKVSNLIVVSELHGSNLILHDKITKASDSFIQATKGIKKLLVAGFNVELRIVIHKKNIRDIVNISRLYVQEFLKVKKVAIFPIDLIGNASLNRRELFIPFEKFVPQVENCIDILKDHFEVSLFHIPFCKIGKEYKKFIVSNSVPDARQSKIEGCNNCDLEATCPKIWKSYEKEMNI